MSVALKDVGYVLRRLCDRHRVDLIDREGSAWRVPSGGIAFKLRSRPWVFEATMSEQDLLLSGAAATFELVSDRLARGAAELRGAIFRDLLLNMNDYPIDFIGDTSEPSKIDKLLQDAENTATRLMVAVDRMRREKP